MIITYYEKNEFSIHETCKKFNIQPKQLREWIKKKNELINVFPMNCKLHKGRLPEYSQLESVLFDWITEQRQLQNPVTRLLIITKVYSLVQNTDFKNLPNIQEFKFSNSWLDGFLDRYNLSNRRCTTIAQHLPEDLEEKKQNFINYILNKRTQYNYPLHLIGNMDETPLTFDLPNPTTIEKRGARTVSVRTTGNEKKKFYCNSWMYG
jgi:hypothetical protein